MNGMFASLKIVATIAVTAGLVLLIFIRNIYAFSVQLSLLALVESSWWLFCHCIKR